MKRLSVLALVLFLSAFLAPVAQAQVTFLKIKVERAMIWPTKPDGKCWDICLGKKFKLPERNLGPEEYTKYFENTEFRKACTGTWAPDPIVQIKIGQYDTFTTTKKDNTCSPEWNVEHTFRVEQGAGFTVNVCDNDGAGGQQVKCDPIGSYTAATVPAELLGGGKLVLKRFGQVEALFLSAQVVQQQAPPAAPSCDGTYRVRIVEYEVKETKANGDPWDKGWGKFKKPDVIVKVAIGSDQIESPKKQDTTAAKLDGVQREVLIKAGTPVRIEVLDQDPKGFDTIGQAAFPDVCTLIRESQNGVYTFKPFEQVVKVVIIFEKK